jgi:ATP-dependent exoDNAse (exonuclease V) beta subunit
VTEILQEPPEYPVSFDSAVNGTPRPRGFRFGTLVHTILRDVTPAASREQIEALAAMHGCIVGAGADEIAAAAASAGAVLQHSVWKDAVSSERMHRELPVTLHLEQRLLEGVLDLAYNDGSGWIVVDYKTDADLDLNRQIYVRQLRWYLHALVTATNAPARGILLQV